MIAVLLSITLTGLAGWGLLRCAGSTGHRLPDAGLAFLYGSGAVWFSLLVLSPFGWTSLRLLVLLLAIVLAATVARQRSAPPVAIVFHPVDFITLLVLAAYSVHAAGAASANWDFWAIWGLKASVFFDHGGIDWQWLLRPEHRFAHPDYPLLVPAQYDFAALLAGGWDDRWLGLITAAFAVALVFVTRGLLDDEMPPLLASVVTLAVCGIVCTPYVGLAEAPFLALGAGALLMLRRGLQRKDLRAYRHGAILLGLAASAKNEGLGMIVSVAVAIVFVALLETFFKQKSAGSENGLTGDAEVIARNGRADRLRLVLQLWPAVLIATPWLVTIRVMKLASDLELGSPWLRIAERLHHLGDITGDLLLHLDRPAAWLLLGVGLLCVRNRRRETFLLAVAGVQFAIYVGVYLATPRNVSWHLETSWGRVSAHLLIPLVVAVSTLLANRLLHGDDVGVCAAENQSRKSLPQSTKS